MAGSCSRLRKGRSDQNEDFPACSNGSKGLGRLACLRMGAKVYSGYSPCTEPTNKYTLEIDWNAYDNAKTVEEILLTIKRSNRAAKETNGTRVAFRISGNPLLDGC